MNEENAPCKPMQALGEATMRLDKVYGGFAKRHGETYLSMWAIDELGHHPEGLTQKQLATALYAPKQTANSVAASLEKRGLIYSEVSPNDKRSRIHLLTEQGRKLYDLTYVEQDRCEKACIEELGQKRISRMITDMNAVLTCIEQAFAEMERERTNQ